MREKHINLKISDEIKRVHKMSLPQKVIIGEGILGKLSNVYDEISVKKNIVVITGPHVYKRLKGVFNENWERNQRVDIIFAGQSTLSEVERLGSIVRKTRGEIIIALGGGRVIDLSKMVAFKNNLEFISVPTTASHDGIASSLASIKGGKRVYSYMAKPPKAIIVDVDIICKAPKRLISSGVGDALAKITAVRDWKLSHEKTGEYFGEYAAHLALMGAKLVMKKAKGIGSGDKESIRTLIEALISDGVAAGIAGSSRPCSGSEHLFSHALDIYSTEHAMHGEQCGVGTIMMAYLHGLNYDRIKKALKDAKAPVNAYELGISPKNVIKALKMAKTVRPERYTILNEVKLDERRAYEIASQTHVI